MGDKLSAEDTLLYMTDYLLLQLESCEELEKEGKADDFVRGVKTGYVEALELIQRWEKAKENGLDWNIEDNFPV